jgi:hypothetical protein
MATCCNNCKWLSSTGRPGEPEKPFCLRNRSTSILLKSVFCDHLEACPDYDDLRRMKVEIRQFVSCVIEAIGSHFSSNDLAVLDLQNRLSRLETELGVTNPPSSVQSVETKAENKPAKVELPVSSLEVKAAQVESPSTREKYKWRSFNDVQRIGAVQILKLLLPKPNDSRNTRFLATQIGIAPGRTQTIINGLIQRNLLKEHRFDKKKPWYGVPPERTKEVDQWISDHSEGVPAATVVEPERHSSLVTDLPPPKEVATRSKKVEDPGEGHPVATLQRTSLDTLILTYPDGKKKSGSRIHDLKRAAWRKGFTINELPDKRVEITYLNSKRDHRARASR